MHAMCGCPCPCQHDGPLQDGPELGSTAYRARSPAASPSDPDLLHPSYHKLLTPDACAGRTCVKEPSCDPPAGSRLLDPEPCEAVSALDRCEGGGSPPVDALLVRTGRPPSSPARSNEPPRRSVCCCCAGTSAALPPGPAALPGSGSLPMLGISGSAAGRYRQHRVPHGRCWHAAGNVVAATFHSIAQCVFGATGSQPKLPYVCRSRHRHDMQCRKLVYKRRSRPANPSRTPPVSRFAQGVQSDDRDDHCTVMVMVLISHRLHSCPPPFPLPHCMDGSQNKTQDVAAPPHSRAQWLLVGGVRLGRTPATHARKGVAWEW